MAKDLVIVESPSKAKTIQKYLGADYDVTSSMGHIRDLPKKGMGVDLSDFTPDYEVSADKKKLVAELKTKAKKANTVWLASDEDREGEAIAWHLSQELKLKDDQTKRIVFHEITKNAILKAIDNPRKININLVNAQQARRILDRIVGFEMSPVLWKKVKTGLSAGRVQSVALRLVAERERDIFLFQPEPSFKVTGVFVNENKNDIPAKLKHDFKTEKEAESFLKKCQSADFKVLNVDTKPGQRSAGAPFTTSTLQQEASNRLGYGVSTTMRIAQQLYEAGYITYMRTDSVNLAKEAIAAAKSAIIEAFGEKYSHPKNYHTKSVGAQEAHEAIRPTDFKRKTISDVRLHKLYDLIYKRAMASQMANAQIEKTVIGIGGKKLESNFEAVGEVIVFDGFLRVYGITKTDEDSEENDERVLPKVKVGETLVYKKIIALEKYTKAPSRFTEASLVKKLEQLGIGRPSTYAPTIQTIQNRKYVEKLEVEPKERQIVQLTLGKDIKKEVLTEKYGADKNKFLPTDIGIVVTKFLVEHFAEIMDYGFTAKVEEDFDAIAAGKEAWKEVLHHFYDTFHPQLVHVEETADRANGERVLGVDPKSGKTVHARVGRYGPMIQIGESEDEEKPKFASLLPSQHVITITLEEALDLFKVPFELNDYEGKPVVIGSGRFGPYVKWGEQYISLARGEDPLTVDNERAIEVIEEKKKADAPVSQYKNKPVTKGVGRFGPYLKYDGIYVNVPKKYDFDNLSQNDISTLIEAKLEKEAKRYIQQWPEEKIALENGRWGAFVRFGKVSIKIPPKGKGVKYSEEELKETNLQQVKDWILASDPKAFDKKKTAVKKAAAKKSTSKKTATRKTTTKKSTTKKAVAGAKKA